MSGRDTIFALSSGRPPAAISVIRISGELAHQAVESLAGSLPGPRRAVVRELRNPGTGDLLDQAIVVRFDGPASATGENIVEIQCHGGRAVVDAILSALAKAPSLRQAEPGEFTRRAFDNGRIDLTEAEGLADLIEAETESQRKAAVAMAEGGLSRQIFRWQGQLLGLAAQAERAIDYDEDDQEVDPVLIHDCSALADELQRWLDRPRAEPLKDGLLVVIAGPPNAGKSSLLNAIVGSDRAIVSETPGTTRDHIEVPLAIGGVPVRLTDTAGLRTTADRVEAVGVQRATRLVDAADILVWLGPEEDAPSHARRIQVRAKSDLLEGYDGPGGSIDLSSKTGEGVAELMATIEEAARSMLPSEGSLAINRRQATHLQESAAALRRAAAAADIVLIAEELRHARGAFDRLTGRAGVEDVLDTLFGRFCLGK
jgi:tRNA modification GTPase